MAQEPGTRTQRPVEFLLAMRQRFAEESVDAERLMIDGDVFAASIAPLATDDFRSTMDGGALTTDYDGIEGLRAGWSDFLAAWDEIELIPGEMREGADGESIVEFVRMIGKPAGASGEVDQPAAAVWRLRGDRIEAVEFFIDQNAALLAGGLDPGNPGPAA